MTYPDRTPAILLCCLTFAASALQSAPLNSLPNTRRAAEYGSLPMRFESNVGQADQHVQYVARGSGYTLLLSSAESRLLLKSRPGSDGGNLRMRFVGARSQAKLEPEERLSGVSNYLMGNDPSGWHIDVPQYARVIQRNAYPGVDIVYYGVQGELEYDLVVRDPKAVPRIKLSFEGATKAEITPEGAIELQMDGDRILQRCPIVYQSIGGKRSRVPGRYVKRGDGTFGFQVSAFRPELPLVIDPVLVYSTFVGGTGWDEAVAIAVDNAGSAYIAGWTTSTNFPTSTGPYQSTQAGGPTFGDVFVVKMNAAGNAVLYSTYIGGSADDVGWALAIDPAGNAYVAGFTSSTNYPTTPGALQRTLGGTMGGFVTKLNAAGTALVYSTYLSGNNQDRVLAIAVDTTGQAYITGRTTSTNFPVSPSAPQGTLGGGTDAFASKLDTNGATLLYSTFLGGSLDEFGNAIAIDNAGNAYLAGYTQSNNFPVTSGAFQKVFGNNAGGGIGDSFLTKLNPTGTAFLYSTYLGGNNDEYARGVALDGSGNVYVSGRTASTNFPVTAGAYQTAIAGAEDIYVTKFTQDGTALVYSTLIGGSSTDQAEAIAIDSTGAAHIAVNTQSFDYPVTPDAFQPSLGASASFNGGLTILNPQGSALLYSTYMGGTVSDSTTSIALDSGGNSYLTGVASSSNYPVTSGAFQPGYGGGSGDAVLSKFNSCFYSLSASPQSFTPTGGSGSFSINSGLNCSWTAVSNASWVSITSGASGAGNGSGSFTVAANSGAGRSAQITAAGFVFTLTQTGACSYSVTPTSQSFDLNGGNGSAAVTASAGCSWTAVSNASWITVLTGASGTGNGTVAYSVAAASAARSATLTIAGITLTVSQLSSTFTPIRVNAGGNSYTDPQGLTWAADTGYSGGSTYSVSNAIANTTTQTLYQSERYGSTFQYSFTVPANATYTVRLKFAEIYFTSPGQRVFNVNINGQQVMTNFDIYAAVGANTAIDKQFDVPVTSGPLVIQFTPVVENAKISAIEVLPAGGCSYAISPNSQSFNLSGGTGTVSVTTGAGCIWTASSSASWASITSGASGSGNGTVTYSVASGTGSRSAALTIAGLTFTISQVNPSFSPIRVNSGGSSYTDPSGQVWAADTGFSSGNTYSTGNAIAKTSTPVLYQSERYSSSPFQYVFSVPNNTYTVTLKFAEIYFTSSGLRMFNVNINGQPVLTNFDIVATAGANTAIDQQFTVPVSGGQIVIQFVPVVENPKISAIEIK